jgi:hypothetical protein
MQVGRKLLRTALIAGSALGLAVGVPVLALASGPPTTSTGCAAAWSSSAVYTVGDLEELAAVCARLSRWSFLLTAAPPRILGMTGIPVNPLAIF